ncbi:MAG: hypothetical protein AB7G15_14040, partial [Alphaproteobacteria bacterium]
MIQVLYSPSTSSHRDGTLRPLSFPVHDPYWVAAAEFVERHRVPPAPVLAPDIFWWRFEQIYRYTNAWQRPSFAYEWAIVQDR